jgi:hypothetical protein
MHIAVALSDPTLIRILLGKGASLELADGSGLTPLHSAVLHSDYTTFQELVNLGAKVAAIDPNGDTVIHSAIKREKWLLVQYLTQTPAYANLVNAAGVPAFQLMRAPPAPPAPPAPQPQPQMVVVDARLYNELKERVTAMEHALSRVAAGRTMASGTCPICHRRFENAAWADHVRGGCHG